MQNQSEACLEMYLKQPKQTTRQHAALLSHEGLHVLTNPDIEQLLPSSPYMLQSGTLEH